MTNTLAANGDWRGLGGPDRFYGSSGLFCLEAITKISLSLLVGKASECIDTEIEKKSKSIKKRFVEFYS